MAPARARSPVSVPRRTAIGASRRAARAIRDHATNPGGTPASTAILMKRYGIPQITEQSVKRTQARGVIALLGYAAISGRDRPARRALAGVVLGGDDEVRAPGRVGQDHAEPGDAPLQTGVIVASGGERADGAAVQVVEVGSGHLSPREHQIVRG